MKSWLDGKQFVECECVALWEVFDRLSGMYLWSRFDFGLHLSACYIELRQASLFDTFCLVYLKRHSYTQIKSFGCVTCVYAVMINQLARYIHGSAQENTWLWDVAWCQLIDWLIMCVFTMRTGCGCLAAVAPTFECKYAWDKDTTFSFDWAPQMQAIAGKCSMPMGMWNVGLS